MDALVVHEVLLARLEALKRRLFLDVQKAIAITRLHDGRVLESCRSGIPPPHCARWFCESCVGEKLSLPECLCAQSWLRVLVIPPWILLERAGQVKEYQSQCTLGAKQRTSKGMVLTKLERSKKKKKKKGNGNEDVVGTFIRPSADDCSLMWRSENAIWV